MIESVLSLILALADITDRETLLFQFSTEQGYDTSCGLSTVACLMDTYWGVPTEEAELVQYLARDTVGSEGLTTSFADMAAILESRGFQWAAYRMNYDQVRSAVGRYAPIIVHYDRPRKHFALLLSADDRSLVVADPATGTTVLSRRDFESRWSGNVILAALPQATEGDRLREAIGSVRGRTAVLDRAARVASRAGSW